MTKNFKSYLKFNESKYAGKYVVFIKGKLFKAGNNLLKMIEEAKKKYPKEVPLITKPLSGESYILNDHF
ncbi:hypothetical protein A2276_04495 [candidate division WOR-1 bacterium RIFOXYA12_FULL_43_27]|uniref:DUF5678 domain-containing protein n=1 Tax=candidate division WOR-1 bacterium RIFOXYC2_FULL_46_14 TaxID=1802587 RepID=A0A1F4U405_UNCSA|nr:MAG: hypothetical protein A2276_04495 [candidate division WOR-1 bacterium RIFOXYA12_FULL_43_27]OGC18915.1 MAG: hypothetical protein A2292_08340 [candidate division WOR-1 bacterium RIFOXYB2_FULL_46_45]OGC29056.1 MAG: hypothetical protein A2232_03405 [candidate division WOR-1 bacterium RIFOXYA2_FULL_46_56]OGC39676.1 MAG: hypothetical protein A2438_06795 [candidate division WOR-1 bacterium RIFOXYC2_FULL_46_14]